MDLLEGRYPGRGWVIAISERRAAYVRTTIKVKVGSGRPLSDNCVWDHIHWSKREENRQGLERFSRTMKACRQRQEYSGGQEQEGKGPRHFSF